MQYLKAPRKSLWKEIANLRFLSTVAILLALGYFIPKTWPARAVGFTGHDALVRSRGSLPSAVRVVQIADSDLQPTAQSEEGCLTDTTLRSIIETVLVWRPSVLGVDIDTSSSRFRGVKIPQTSIPIVWARDAKLVEDRDGGKVKGYTLSPRAVLGQAAEDPPYTGLAMYPSDSGDVVRGFHRRFRVNTGIQQSFHYVLFTVFCATDPSTACQGSAEHDVEQHDSSGTHEAEVYDFVQDFRSPIIPFADIVKIKPTDSEIKLSPLYKQIVIVGGDDSVATPFGLKSGAQLAALALDTELKGHTSGHINIWQKIFVKCLLAFLLVLAQHFLIPRYALMCCLALIGVTALGSFVAYYYATYQLEFISFAIGILLERLYQSGEGG